MIEVTLYNYLTNALENVPVYMEIPEDTTNIPKYVILEKIDAGLVDHIKTATIAADSYASSLYEAAELGELVKNALFNAITLDEISSVRLGGESSGNDTQKKRYKYECTINLYHY